MGLSTNSSAITYLFSDKSESISESITWVDWYIFPALEEFSESNKILSSSARYYKQK